MNESQKTMRGEAGRLLGAATLLGGKRLTSIIEMLAESDVAIPMDEWDALKYRNVGRKALSELKQLGLVKESPANELSCRAANCLNNAGIETKEQARQAIIEGRLKPDKKAWNWNAPNQNRGIRNYGWKTHKEVCKWVGLPEPHKPKRVQICPHCGKDVLLPPNAKLRDAGESGVEQH